MDAALFGLLGTLVGGAITIVVALINFKKEFSLWEIKFLQNSVDSSRNLRLERYACYLGSYSHLKGCLNDIVDILQQNKHNTTNRISDLVSEPHFENAVTSINGEKGWLILICNDVNIIAKVTEQEKLFDSIIEHVGNLQTGKTKPPEVVKTISPMISQLDIVSDQIIELLRRDTVLKLPE